MSLKTDRQSPRIVMSLSCLPATESSSVPEPTPLLTRRFAWILATQTLVGFSCSVFYILPKFLTQSFHATATDVGRVNAVYGVAGALAVPFVGTLLDRWGRAPVLKFGSLAMACAAFLVVRVESPGLFLLTLRALQGIAFAMAYNAAMTMAADDAPAERLGHAIGLVGLAGLWTNAAGPAAAELIGDRFGYGFAFLASALSAVGAAGLSCRLASPLARTSSERGSGFASALRSAQTWPSLVAIAISGAAFGAMFTFHQPFAIALGIRRISTFFIGYAAGAVMVRLGLGRFIDRMGCYRVAVGSLLLYGTVVFAMQWLTPGRFVWLALSFGVAHGLFYPAICAVAIQHVSPRTRGSTLSACNGAFNAGLFLSGLGFGPLAERSGYPSVYLAAGLVAWMGGVFLWGAGVFSAPSAPDCGPRSVRVPEKG